MSWFGCDFVRCNCSKFFLLGSVIIYSVEVVFLNVGIEVDEDEDVGNVFDDVLLVLVDNGNDDNLDLVIIFYIEYIKLKGCIYYDYFKVVFKFCKLRL